MEKMDVSEIHVKRFNVKEKLTLQNAENFFLPIADGKVKKIWARSGSQNIHLNPGSSSPRKVKEIFKENQTDLLHNFFKTHHRFDEEARNDF